MRADHQAILAKARAALKIREVPEIFSLLERHSHLLKSFALCSRSSVRIGRLHPSTRKSHMTRPGISFPSGPFNEKNLTALRTFTQDKGNSRALMSARVQFDRVKGFESPPNGFQVRHPGRIARRGLNKGTVSARGAATAAMGVSLAL